MPPGNPNPFRPAVARLEEREVPAIVSAQLSGGTLFVYGDGFVNNFVIDQNATTVTVTEVVTNDTRTFARSAVSAIDVSGGAANDSFTSTGNVGIVVTMRGYGGDDIFAGGPATEVMYGGQGRDHMDGGAGPDVINGAKGADFILGGAGRDFLNGGDGADTVNGGAGADAINGGNGNDILVAIDNGINDTLDSGASGTDTLWFDQNGALQDGVTGITPDDFLRAVAVFANGADKTLDGDRIADPAVLGGFGSTDSYETFIDRPLFATGGPTLADIQQVTGGFGGGGGGGFGGPRLDDSWLLSSFGSMLNAFPNLIKTNVVDFGDGTYGVRLNGTYYRVDNDLPVNRSGDVLSAYANVGVDNSLWVPILEKVFATATSTTNPSYALLDRGSNSSLVPSVAFQAFGAGTGGFQVPGTFVSSAQLANFVASALQSNLAVVFTVAAGGGGGGGFGLRSGQSYAITDFGLDAFGNVINFTFRDILGNGGNITVSTATLFGTTGRLDIGDFSTV